MLTPSNDSVELDYILDCFEDAVKRFLQNDLYLLEHNVHERTITHKLGEYLQPLFPEWNVDCEYNRNGHDPKSVGLPVEGSPEATKYVSVLPDIIVHGRGKNNRNLLIIEAKKSNDGRPDGEIKDEEKLEAFADNDTYKYKVGVFVRFYTGTNPVKQCEYKYYCNGEWSEPKDCSLADAVIRL